MKSMRIHLIGVCGVAMGTLAAMLREQGHVVSGSDAGVYPPMSTMLEKWGVTLHEGYDPALLDGVDLTIVGNAVSRGNPQVERVLDERLPYCSMPAALHRFFSGRTRSDRGVRYAWQNHHDRLPGAYTGRGRS